MHHVATVVGRVNHSFLWGLREGNGREWTKGQKEARKHGSREAWRDAV
jgi:hypothetical protein